jgi:hypothetical protein
LRCFMSFNTLVLYASALSKYKKATSANTVHEYK